MANAFTSVEISLLNSSSSKVLVGLVLDANVKVAQPASSAAALRFPCWKSYSAFSKVMLNNNSFYCKIHTCSFWIGVFGTKIVISADVADKARGATAL